MYFNATKAACEKVPGFRMVVVRFKEQMPIMLELCLGKKPVPTSNCTDSLGWFYVDMIKENGEPRINGNIPVNETNLSLDNNCTTDNINKNICINDISTVDFFIFARFQLHDDTITWDMFPVCQANPFGVNW
jgi:hypothetical protein